MSSYRIQFYNECSLLVSFPGMSMEMAHHHVIWLDDYCTGHFGNLLLNHIPAYESLLLVCAKSGDALVLSDAINRLLSEQRISEGLVKAAEVVVPVCYDSRLGNDLEQMAGIHGVGIDTLVSLHQQVVYHVYLLGFLPGFAYMGVVDERIVTPRKPVPVPTKAGAVGIAGRQTGIYPLNSPGGWNIVGYTPLKMFDVTKTSPSLLNPGNQVKFLPIDLETYYSMLENGNGNN